LSAWLEEHACNGQACKVLGWYPGSGNAVWTAQSLFFRVIQRGKDYWNAAFFCGSCAVVRRSALDAIGGFATGTVTEDLHTSVRIHAKGYKSIYHAEALAFGLAPESIAPFISQRLRWGQGAMHVWRMEGILRHRGLNWAQRVNYLASVLTYFDGWQRAVFYIVPVIVLLSGTLPLLTTTPDFLWHFVPYYLLTFWVFEVPSYFQRMKATLSSAFSSLSQTPSPSLSRNFTPWIEPVKLSIWLRKAWNLS